MAQQAALVRMAQQEAMVHMGQREAMAQEAMAHMGQLAGHTVAHRKLRHRQALLVAMVVAQLAAAMAPLPPHLAAQAAALMPLVHTVTTVQAAACMVATQLVQ